MYLVVFVREWPFWWGLWSTYLISGPLNRIWLLGIEKKEIGTNVMYSTTGPSDGNQGYIIKKEIDSHRGGSEGGRGEGDFEARV